MTTQQNKILHGLLALLNLMHTKEALVLSYSQGRTGKSSELEPLEAMELINFLRNESIKLRNKDEQAGAKKFDPIEDKILRTRRAICGKIFELGRKAPHLHYVVDKKINAEKLSELLMERVGKKKLNDLDQSELNSIIIYLNILNKNYENK